MCESVETTSFGPNCFGSDFHYVGEHVTHRSLAWRSDLCWNHKSGMIWIETRMALALLKRLFGRARQSLRKKIHGDRAGNLPSCRNRNTLGIRLPIAGTTDEVWVGSFGRISPESRTVHRKGNLCSQRVSALRQVHRSRNVVFVVWVVCARIEGKRLAISKGFDVSQGFGKVKL